MKTTTAHNHLARLISALDSEYSIARIGQIPCPQLVANLKRSVWEDPGLARCPSWVKTHLAGYDSAKWKALYSDLAWLFPTPSGPKEWEALTPDERQVFTTNEPRQTGSHYWLKPALHKGKSAGTLKGRTLTRVYEVTDRTF